MLMTATRTNSRASDQKALRPVSSCRKRSRSQSPRHHGWLDEMNRLVSFLLVNFRWLRPCSVTIKKMDRKRMTSRLSQLSYSTSFRSYTVAATARGGNGCQECNVYPAQRNGAGAV